LCVSGLRFVAECKGWKIRVAYQAAISKGPSMSPVKDHPPHPLPFESGNVSWPMNDFDAVSVERAMPKPKFVRAPKKRWNWIPVAWSVNAEV